MYALHIKLHLVQLGSCLCAASVEAKKLRIVEMDELSMASIAAFGGSRKCVSPLVVRSQSCSVKSLVDRLAAVTAEQGRRRVRYGRQTAMRASRIDHCGRASD